jgi:CAAX prenyl protease-like protein
MKRLLPHALPYVLFVVVESATGPLGPWADVLGTLLAGAALAWFAIRGAYPELRTRSAPGATLAGVAMGIAVGAAWVPLATLVPSLGDTTRTGLDPGRNLVFTAVRIVAMVGVVPFAEELFVRSALPRFVDARHDEDWRALPVGKFTLVSAAASVAFFTLTHPEWLAALATGIAWTALLAKTRDLRALVVSHAVANAWLAGYVVVTGQTQWW